MKQMLVLLTLAISPLVVFCQINELPFFEKKRIDLNKKAMLVLGGWSSANIIIGAIGTNTNNREARYFNQMNVIWNSVNLLIAGAGYYSASKESLNDLTISKVMMHQNKTEKAFLFNTGLDLAYVTTGLYLTERSKRNADPAKLKGYGNSVMLQGGFLFLLDAVTYKLQQRRGKHLNEFIEKLTVVAGPCGVTLCYTL
jgi:hypothetical protein